MFKTNAEMILRFDHQCPQLLHDARNGCPLRGWEMAAAPRPDATETVKKRIYSRRRRLDILDLEITPIQVQFGLTKKYDSDYAYVCDHVHEYFL